MAAPGATAAPAPAGDGVATAPAEDSVLSVPRLVVKAANLVSELQRLRQELGQAKDDLSSTRAEKAALEAELRHQRAAGRQQVSALQEHVTRLQGQVEAGVVTQQEQLRHTEQYRAEREALLVARETASSSLSADVQRLQGKLAAKEAEASMLQAQLDSQTVLVEALDRELSELRKQLADVRLEVNKQQQALDAHCDAVQKQMVDEKQMVSALAVAAKAKLEAEKATAAAEAAMQKLQEEVSRLNQRLQAADEAAQVQDGLLAQRQAALSSEVGRVQELSASLQRSEQLVTEGLEVQQQQLARLTQLQQRLNEAQQGHEARQQQQAKMARLQEQLEQAQEAERAAKEQLAQAQEAERAAKEQLAQAQEAQRGAEQQAEATRLDAVVERAAAAVGPTTRQSRAQGGVADQRLRPAAKPAGAAAAATGAVQDGEAGVAGGGGGSSAAAVLPVDELVDGRSDARAACDAGIGGAAPNGATGMAVEVGGSEEAAALQEPGGQCFAGTCEPAAIAAAGGRAIDAATVQEACPASPGGAGVSAPAAATAAAAAAADANGGNSVSETGLEAAVADAEACWEGVELGGVAVVPTGPAVQGSGIPQVQHGMCSGANGEASITAAAVSPLGKRSASGGGPSVQQARVDEAAAATAADDLSPSAKRPKAEVTACGADHDHPPTAPLSLGLVQLQHAGSPLAATLLVEARAGAPDGEGGAAPGGGGAQVACGYEQDQPASPRCAGAGLAALGRLCNAEPEHLQPPAALGGGAVPAAPEALQVSGTHRAAGPAVKGVRAACSVQLAAADAGSGLLAIIEGRPSFDAVLGISSAPRYLDACMLAPHAPKQTELGGLRASETAVTAEVRVSTGVVKGHGITQPGHQVPLGEGFVKGQPERLQLGMGGKVVGAVPADKGVSGVPAADLPDQSLMPPPAAKLVPSNAMADIFAAFSQIDGFL